MSNFYQQIQAWITKPFTTPLDTIQIFLLVGLLVVAFIFWARLIAHFQE
jgi:hypothetical protein